MRGQNKVSGVVLAGGQGSRMERRDKGLVLFRGRPMVVYALTALAGLTEDIVISANRNLDIYAQFGYPVIPDGRAGFDGPLAGILAAMRASRAEFLLVMPCDSPLLKTEHLRRLLTALDEHTDIAVADDGKQLHPVVLALKTCLHASLADYLCSGERKLQNWLFSQTVVRVDFSDQPMVFANLNTPAELAALQLGEA